MDLHYVGFFTALSLLVIFFHASTAYSLLFNIFFFLSLVLLLFDTVCIQAKYDQWKLLFENTCEQALI